MPGPRLTLLQTFAGGAALVAVLLGVLAAVVLAGTRRSILDSAEKLRAAAALRAEELVLRQLSIASEAVDGVERDLDRGLVRADDPLSVEAALFRQLARDPLLAEVTLIRADRVGYGKDGEIEIAPAGRWQVSVSRASDSAESPILTRLISQGPRGFAARLRTRSWDAEFSEGAFVREGPAPDPTTHLTFRSAASRAWSGLPIWTDLAFAQLDAALPRERRRVLVSVQKAVEDSGGRFVGVIRAGILAAGIDGIAKLKVNESDPADPHRLFLADSEGRLVTRLEPEDRLELADDALRVRPARLPRAIELALSSDVLKKARGAERSGELIVDGERYLMTFRPLAATQDWLAGIVVPESAYTAELHRLRARLATAIALVLALILIGGGIALAALRRGLGSIVQGAARMRQLQFAAADTRAPFRDVQEVLGSLEQAKTAMRALGKYVPVDLVRELWSQNREPVLGGELRDLSILFTDLEGFTSLAEKLSPDELARRLGLYLQTMTEAIRSSGGTIDKFVGDAVMALWNAPTPRANHASLACQAILRCRSATQRLYASEAWQGVPALRTRFGLHRDRVMVGHFGAPERLSYTALGDGVNLAARLESLCKQYGVDAIASGAVVEEAQGEFVFRLLDRVAVKGKTSGVLVYELLGAAGEEIPNLAAARAYELAFEAYSRRDFDGAIARLQQHPGDPPSVALLQRCRSLVERPPPAHWDGVHVAATK